MPKLCVSITTSMANLFRFSSIDLTLTFDLHHQVVGGAVGMGFALPEAIDNWKDLIEKNHETEASRSLRDTADDILKMCRTLKDQFDNMRY